jgi:hypothetical protein
MVSLLLLSYKFYKHCKCVLNVCFFVSYYNYYSVGQRFSVTTSRLLTVARYFQTLCSLVFLCFACALCSIGKQASDIFRKVCRDELNLF